ncbi:MAG: hypothetical protein ACI9XK_001330 [Granulosicoccus sp.]
MAVITDNRTVGASFLAYQFVKDALAMQLQAKHLEQQYSGLDWMVVMQVAGDNLVTPLLCTALHQAALMPLVPDEPAAALRWIMRANAERNEELLASWQRLSDILKSAGVAHLPLKGTTLLLEGVYPKLERIVSDIDVYVPPDQIPDALAAMSDTGYLQISNVNDPKQLFSDIDYAPLQPTEHRNNSLIAGYQLPGIIESGGNILIELHYCIVEGNKPLSDYLNNSASLLSKRSTDAEGYDTWTATQTRETRLFNLAHTFYHSHIKDAAYYTGTVDLRHIYDIAAMAQQDAKVTHWAIQQLRVMLEGTVTEPLLASFVNLVSSETAQSIKVWSDLTENERKGIERFNRLARAGQRYVRWLRFKAECRRQLRFLITPGWLRSLYGDRKWFEIPISLIRYAVNRAYRRARRK